MKPSISLSVLALLFFFQISSLSATTTLEQLCDYLGGVYVTRDYCMNTLKTDPSSSSADVKGLGVIAVNLTIANATNIEAKLAQLLNKKEDKAVRVCYDLYRSLIPSLRWAADSIALKLNRTGVLAVLNNAFSMPVSCGAQQVPSITKDNNAFSTLANLARAIARYLAG